MNAKSWLGLALGVLVMLFGLACLNYNYFDGIEHHFEWAEANGLPTPSGWIFDVGLALAPIGGGIIGWRLAKRTKAKAAPA